jgi:hypothetical protein
MTAAGKRIIEGLEDAIRAIKGRRVLVCGGREFTDKDWLERVLDAMHTEEPIGAIIEGEARGADKLAADWARSRGVSVLRFPANWSRDGKRAGPVRNQAMLDKGGPHIVVAFPGGIGTMDMVRRSRRCGYPVMEMEP